MRRLDEWHKYVDLQAKRVNSVKAGQSTIQDPDSQDERGDEQSVSDPSYQDASLDDHYADGALAEVSYIRSASDSIGSERTEEPLPELLRPTPLPALIEFAADDLTVPSQPAQEDKLVGFPPPAKPAASHAVPRDRPAKQALSPSGLANGVASSVEDHAAPRKLARNGRPQGAARKETREELLARLLDPELTLEEAAQVLNVCPTTVRRYTNRGVLPHYRTIGNQRRFRLSQVLAFLETQASGALPARALTTDEES